MSDTLPDRDQSERLRKALVALQQMRARVERLERAANEPIAIVGLGCRFPGGADGPAAFWDLLRNGVDAVTEIPADRWPLEAFYDPDPDVPGRMYARHGAFLRDVDRFDAHFFGMAPREAVKTDPQHRLLLEVAWEALEHAGIVPSQLVESQTGVFVGITLSDYDQLLNESGPNAIDAYHMTGSCLNFAAGRLAYTLGLQGPAMAIDTACSSSLVAVHLACQSLRNAECSLALAGGVNLMLSPERTIAACKARMLSATGRARTFDAAADGFVRGEGCGVVVLRRLSDAVAAGDTIWAIIRGSAVNQDGPSSGLTVPNRAAQEAVIREALRRAGVAPADVDYVEAHGTGTPLGDPIEVRALGAVLAEGRTSSTPFFLGSVKTNVGHLESAAGVAGLIKVVLALHHGEIPPHLNFATPNPSVEWSSIPVRIATTLSPWPLRQRPRLAALSSFGGSGTNAHMVLEQGPLAAIDTPRESTGAAVALTVSGRTPAALRSAAQALHRLVARPPEGFSVEDICYTTSVRRSHHEHRLVVAGAPDSLANELGRYLEGSAGWSVATGKRRTGVRARPVFVFTGQGPQWWGMGRELFASEPIYRAAIEQISDLLSPLAGWSLVDELSASEARSRLSQTEVAQPAIFAVQMGVAALLRSWGVEPAAVVGHSVGEIAAACVAGVVDLPTGVRIAFHRGRLMQRATGLGRMAAAGLSESEARALDAVRDGSLFLAAVNGPKSITLAGEGQAVEAVIASLQARDVFCRALAVDYAFHTPQMASLSDELVPALQRIERAPARIPIASTVTGDWATAADFDASYWGRNVRQPVLFSRALGVIAAEGYATLVEIGPHPALGGSMAQCFQDAAEKPVIVPSLYRGRPERASLIASLGALHANGATVDWVSVQSARCVPLPPYPWQRERYWLDPPARSQSAARSAQAWPEMRRIDSVALDGQVFEWEVSADSPGLVRDHRVYGRTLFPATFFFEMAREASARILGRDAFELRDLRIASPLVIDEDRSYRIQVAFASEADGAVQLRLASSDDNPAGGWTVHVTGQLVEVESEGPSVFESDDLRTGHEEVTRTAHYRALADRGLDFGPAFQSVAAIWREDGRALAEVTLRGSTAPHSVLRPLLVDGAMQAIWAALPSAARAATDDAFLPVGVKSIRFGGHGFVSSEEDLVSHVAVTSTDGDDTGGWIADLTLATPDGRMLARLSGVLVKRAGRSVLHSAARLSDPSQWVHAIEWLPVAREPIADVEGETWIVLDDEQGVGTQLNDWLRQRGASSWLVRQGTEYANAGGNLVSLDALQPEHFQRLLAEVTSSERLSGIVDLWPLRVSSPSASQSAGVGALLHLVQAIGRDPAAGAARLLAVTRGGRSVHDSRARPGQSPVWGLAAVIRSELPELQIKLVDLDPSGTEDVQDIVTEFNETREPEVAFRSGARLVPRLVQDSLADSARSSANMTLEIQERGILENLHLAPTPRCQPGPGEVELRVTASGVNFRDVLNALGTYEGKAGPLGSECAGTIISVGDGVQNLKPGDEVIAVAESTFSRFVTTRDAFAVARPASISSEQAATLPIAFLTAKYALEDLAQIKKGDRVLIHAAAGGVGLAALQVAQRAGAEVIATAGSAAKQEYLRSRGVRHIFNSRSLDFAPAVLAATEGRGVDIVLNSLTGDFIERSLSVLSKGGRFVEIGKAGIWSSERVAAARPDVAYHVLYLGDVLERDPEIARRLLADLVRDVDAGVLEPLPLRSFAVREAAAAFRHMAQARHIGKVLLTQDSAQPVVDSASTYLITGGLGALGMHLGAALVSRGCRNLVLVGRRGPTATVEARLDEWRREGVRVEVLSADVGSAVDLDRVLKVIAETMPTLKGAFHAAGVVDDGVVGQQTFDRFERVFAPKARGAWLLHERLSAPLDFFVLFSSTSSILGSAGQATYASANAFLDGLAHARRSAGLAALSVNWGAWATSGMAAELSTADRRRWEAQGFGVIDPAQGCDLLFELLGRDRTQAVVLPADWRRYTPAAGSDGVPALLSQVATRTERSPAVDRALEPAAWEPIVERTVPSQRLGVAARLLAEQALKVLGLPTGYELDHQQGLRDVGLDSLMAVELRNRVQASAGRALSPTFAFDFPTVSAMARYLVVDVFELALQNAAPSITATAAAEPGLTELSDEEAEALLREELSALQRVRQEH